MPWSTVYVKSFEGKTFTAENFVLCNKSHMHGSSVYGVLELEDSHFNTCTMVDETREFKSDSFVHGYHVCWMLVIVEQLHGL